MRRDPGGLERDQRGAEMKAATGISNPFLQQTIEPAVRSVEPTGGKHKGVVFRLSPSDWRKLKEFALASDTSIQVLIERGLSAQLIAAGLDPLVGQPRPRGK